MPLSPEAKAHRKEWERKYNQTPKRRAYVIALAKAWRAKNRERDLEYKRQYRAKHRETYNAYHREWARKQREKKQCQKPCIKP